MLFTTPPARNSSRANNSQNGHRHRADFARQATISAFGRHARALDEADFVDRLPGDPPRPSPESGLAE